MFALTFCALAVTAQGPNPKLSENAKNHVERAKEEISQEILSLTNHPWAGQYFEGDGLGVTISLFAAPNQGFAFEWRGCGGLYDRNYGSVTEADDLIHLAFTFPNQREGFAGIAGGLYIVRWGDRRYLIPTNNIIDFCNSVNSGLEPRSRPHGSHLLRIGDELKEVSGVPSIPSSFQSYLLKQPITVEIKKIITITTNANPPSYRYYETSAAVDLNAQHLLQPGMQLYLLNQERVFATAFVSEVSSSTAKLTIETSKTFPLPQVGWRFSTSPWWRPSNKP